MYSDVLTAKILDAKQCAELKMGSYLGVAAASANPPHFIHLCYRPPNGDVKTKLAIVGKGLTFDRYCSILDCENFSFLSNKETYTLVASFFTCFLTSCFLTPLCSRYRKLLNVLELFHCMS